MMPPTNIPPNELWSALTTMPRPHKIVDFPRKAPDGKPIGQLAIRALTQNEQLQAGIAAERLVRAELTDAKKDASIGYEISYSNAASVEQLWRACRCADDLERPCFPSPKEMRGHLTTDEIGALYSAFLDVCAEVGPIIGAMTSAESEAWIDRLIEGGESADPIPFFSSEGLKTLVRTSVARLRTSRTGPSSAGSPQSELGLEKSDEPDRIGNDEDGGAS
jgi:hypothetical protein